MTSVISSAKWLKAEQATDGCYYKPGYPDILGYPGSIKQNKHSDKKALYYYDSSLVRILKLCLFIGEI